MNPKDTPDCNFTYLGPSEDVGDLRVLRTKEDGHRAVFSWWDLTEQERGLAAAGADLKLGIYDAEPIPPVSVELATPYCPSGCEVTCDLVADPREETATEQVFACPRCHVTANGSGVLPAG
jgi:hypothetical protein